MEKQDRPVPRSASVPGRSGNPRQRQNNEQGTPHHATRGADDRRPRSGSPKLPPQQFEAAKKLAQDSGLPLGVAIGVIRGQIPLNEALHRAMLVKKVNDAIESGSLPRYMLQKVLAGSVSLEKAIFDYALKTIKTSDEYKKCNFDEFAISQEPVVLGLVDKRSFTCVIREALKWDIVVQETGKDPITFQKHDVKFYFKASEKKAVLKRLEWGPKNKRVEPAQLATRSARIEFKARVFHELMTNHKTARFITREGDVVRGKVLWYGKWEVLVDLGDGVTAVLLRHALENVES